MFLWRSPEAAPLVGRGAKPRGYEGASQGVNFKTVRRTVLKEGTPCKRRRPLQIAISAKTGRDISRPTLFSAILERIYLLTGSSLAPVLCDIRYKSRHIVPRSRRTYILLLVFGIGNGDLFVSAHKKIISRSYYLQEMMYYTLFFG